MFDGQLVRDSFERRVPCRFFRQRSSQGRCPWLWCVWPLANRTGRDVRWPNAIPGFFANGDIHHSLGQRPRNRVMVCMAVGQSNRSRCSMAQMRHPVFFAKGDIHHSLGQRPRSGYGELGSWPIEPVAMFDGPMRYPVFFAKGDTHHSLGQRPRSGCVDLGRWPIGLFVMFGCQMDCSFFLKRRYSM